MRCLSCQFENPDEMRFCVECGVKLEQVCPRCLFSNEPQFKFCGQCGNKLGEATAGRVPEVEGERKQVTVLFSDLSGYTAMSERIDPEEVRDIMAGIFGGIAKVIAGYEGFVEKFLGDAVMAVFGVPSSHEDDPVRAILAAREIHELVKNMSPALEARIGQPLSMHTGINTGLVVTGDLKAEKGKENFTGDTINLASRLQGIAKAGEILVGPATYQRAGGYFTFDFLGATKVKGKADPIRIYKVLAPKERPTRTHHVHGARAELIGRRTDLLRISESMDQLRKGQGSVVSISGRAGTGKSRLVEEFRGTLDPAEVQWHEGRAHAYHRDVPYSPFTELLGRAFQIKENDPPLTVRDKIGDGIASLIGKRSELAPCVGRLFAVTYPEAEEVSPEFWKTRLHETVKELFSSLAGRAPTVIYLEDLHWADPSSIELLKYLLIESTFPALFLCVQRPAFSLFQDAEQCLPGRSYLEIRLQDLSPADAEDMLESLLQAGAVPPELKRFVEEKVEGNPFYLEEAVNSLIESGTLIKSNGAWKVTRPIVESDISSTIYGVISARLDRLEKENKRVLQEASVIGRAFQYDILRRVTECKGDIERRLSHLEESDLIRSGSPRSDLEYIFKHALTH